MNRINVVAFDTETVEGEPLTIQFASQLGTELHRVTRASILPTFITALHRLGCDDAWNMAWAHQLEFDIGQAFIQVPQIWGDETGSNETYELAFELPGGLSAEFCFKHFASPFHIASIGGQRWQFLDTMSFMRIGLAKACKRLKLPTRKLPRPRYIGRREPTLEEWPRFEEYARNDAQATRDLALYILKWHELFGIRPTVSIAQMAATVFRHKFLMEEINDLP
jgi:hypothetical protein